MSTQPISQHHIPPYLTPFRDGPLLADFIHKIGAEPKEAKFDAQGYLIKLDLSGLNLTHLPPEIGNFSRLQALVLGELVVIEDEERFERVGNNITQLPTEIGGLTNLRELSLSYNSITELPPEIGGLTNLQRLLLDSNRLTELPPELGGLINLQWLSLNSNRLTKLPPEIGGLTNLQQLLLNSKRLTELPPEIGGLTNLQQLGLISNRLTELPSEIGGLTNLRMLSLDTNRLTELPPEIGGLTNLEWLSLYSNRLTELPPEIGRLTNLRYLLLSGNPLRTPPPEIVERGQEAVLDFLRDLDKYGAVTRYEAKVLLVGEGATGKSSLLRALRGETFEERLSTTHGIEVKPYELPHPDEAEKIMRLHVWDFGGQQIYHTTHQFFMTQRSLYLLLWNARGETDQARLDQWLRNIEALAPNAPVLLVATHIDERPEDFNYQRFKESYPQLIGHIGVSNKTGAGIEDLKRILARQAVNLELMEQQWPKSWVDAEAALRQSGRHYLTLDAFTTICTQQGVSAEIAQTVLGGYLHDLGKILYYQDDETLCDFVVLKPNWLTRAISRVLDDEPTRLNEGILPHRELRRIWDKDEHGEAYPRHLYPRFLRLMERFLISFQLDRHAQDRRSLVPLRFSYTPPSNLPPWAEVVADQPQIQMRFQLKHFVPPGIMSWFIVLTHQYSQGIHWREGVRLHYEGQQAEVILNPSEYELWLRVCGAQPSNFFNILQHTIHDRILRYYFVGLAYSRHIPCNCHLEQGETTACTHFHDYERLVERMKRNKLYPECDISFEKVSVPLLLEGIHYSTDDKVAQKLAAIQKAQAQHIEISRYNIEMSRHSQRLLVQQRQMFEQLNSHFSRLWNAQMANLQAECPNTFMLMPGNRRNFNPKKLLSEEYTLYLLCQHPAQPHIVAGEEGEGYPISEPHQWFAKVAPWLQTLIQYLKFIPSAGLTKAYDDQFYKEVDLSLNVFDAVIKALPDLQDSNPDAFERPHFREMSAEGAALRALHAFLKDVDPTHRWCGLHKTYTNDGNILWLCREHRRFHEV